MVSSISSKVQNSIDKIQFGSKNYWKTFVKHSNLLEKFVSKLKREKISIKVSQPIDLTDYKAVKKHQKIEEKLKKQIHDLENDEIKIKRLKDVLEKRNKEEEELLEAKNKKKQLLDHLQEKAKARHEQIFQQKRQIIETSPLKLKPKYIEMEQVFKKSHEIPELERRKAELAKKRILFQPISRQDWLDHMKKHDEYMIEAEKKRLAKIEENSNEKTSNLVNNVRRAIAAESKELKATKKNMIEKRKRYGELVRDIYAPKIEAKPDIVQDNSIKIEKTLEKVSDKSFSESLSLSKKPKKVKKPKILGSKTPEIKPEVKLDYLAEIRSKRFQDEDPKSLDSVLTHFGKISVSEDKSKFLEKLKKYEKIASMQEYKMKQIDPTSLISLELEEKINEVLMQSVRAKINMLE